ncbi:AAA family ATPase [Magnetovibrio sp. PR-2]|uniref:AAA family ATPase n=1 Tax=Magnetovibrio sp. PR-2 TaxID=3120356 RepID=UPI002FCE425F
MSTYFNLRILGVDDREHSSVVGVIAYTMRSRLHDAVLKALGHKKHTFDFRAKRGELYESVLLVPPNAPDFWQENPEIIWTECERAEIAASTGKFRKGAQLAKAGTVHFDRVAGIPLWEQVECLKAFCKQKFVDHDLVVQIDVHPYGSALLPDSNDDDRQKFENELRLHPNTQVFYVDEIPAKPPCNKEHVLRLPDGRVYVYMPHGHLTISTRTVGPEGFSKKKARHLNPGFANGRVTDGDDWTDTWVNHQNEWYGARGHELRIVKANFFERRQTGKAYRTETGRDEADAIREETLRRLCDPDALIEVALEHQATFSVLDLRYLLRRAGMTPEDAERRADEALQHRDVVPLYDVMTSEPRRIYTRTDVREQERMVLRLSDVIASQRYDVTGEAIQNAIASRTMNAEQIAAFQRHVGGDGITFTQGRAGAGKSYMLSAVREAHEACGYRVIGLAPTNTVAADMKKDGFGDAFTVHAALFKAEKGKLGWTANNLIVVDESAMLDSVTMLKLFREVAQSGAKLVMVGDDRQLSSVSRGGLWPLLTDRHSASLMNEINRQEADWQKAASVAFSEGRIGDAVRAYDDKGYVHWDDTLDNAFDALLEKYEQDLDEIPDAVRFIYASTNVTVNAVNAEIHRRMVQRGQVRDVQEFLTNRGRISMGIGDRMQFYDNKKQDAIINGLMGRVISTSPDEIRVQTDAGDEVAIDPCDYKNFGHGYAGTVYRGQGKTVSQSYCLYDSKFSWSAKSAYVAMTRHKKQVDLFVPRELAPDFEHLVRQISREGRDGASLNWATEADLQEFKYVTKTQAPASIDPFKATWSKLWSTFVAKVSGVFGERSEPERIGVQTILETTTSAPAENDNFDAAAYRRSMFNRPRYDHLDEFSSLSDLAEVLEDEARLSLIHQKIYVLQNLAQEKGWDLTDDPRTDRNQALEHAQQQQRLREAQRENEVEEK